MIGETMEVSDYFKHFSQALTTLDPAEIRALADGIHRCYVNRKMVFLCGNGGSGSNASHVCEDLGKGTIRRKEFDDPAKVRLKVLSLTDNTPYILAWGNDEGFDRVFVEQLKNLASPGDLLIAISGSGNSPNVLKAVEWANANGLSTFGCTGFDGGKLRKLAQQSLHAPSDDMGIVESLHLLALHWVIDNLLGRISPVRA
jgi:D-sedoheptulose 7-phosphate isomerase